MSIVIKCLMCMQFKGIKTQVLLCINITVVAEIETAVVVTYNSWDCVWFKIVLVLELSLADWRVDEESSLLYMEIVHCKGVLPRVLLSYLKMQQIQWLIRCIWTVSSRRYNIKRLVLALSTISNCLKLFFFVVTFYILSLAILSLPPAVAHARKSTKLFSSENLQSPFNNISQFRIAN